MKVLAVAIIPKHVLISGPKATALIHHMMDNAAREATDYFGRTTATWKTVKVKFTTTRDKFTRTIRPTGSGATIYGYTDLGTRAHIIRARKAKALYFATGGTPKTRPNVVGSAGGAPGDQFRRAKEVHHPGTDARNFSKSIGKLMDKSFVARAKQLSKDLAK